MLGKRIDLNEITDTHWDLVVIGGGITGAGILLEAARRGFKVLLLEQRDYAWGTSSRSSKMVHGGLRYLAQGDFKLTRHSLLEREWLIRELPELVIRQHYLFPIRQGMFPGRWALKGALWLYDFLAGIRDHRWLSKDRVLNDAPGLRSEKLRGAMTYTDALTDDSRLVMRVLHDAVKRGGVAYNYVHVADVEENTDGAYHLRAENKLNGARISLNAKHVINATGAWADQLSGAESRVRPQRGSHLFVSQDRLPVDQCFTLLNPEDNRPIFVFPWEGRTCIGTTDIDHKGALSDEPFCTSAEIDYLLRLANHQFPQAALTHADIISTMAGVRPIIASGKGVNPSAERRDHAVWQAKGIITVSGGKLTTFRLIALDALYAANLISKAELKQGSSSKASGFDHSIEIYGTLGHPLAPMPSGDELTSTLNWVLRNEQVEHLDDLLLRRTRLGNLLPDGAKEVFDRVRACCTTHLKWDESRWQNEVQRYQEIIRNHYGIAAEKTEQEQTDPLKDQASELKMA